MIKIELPDEIEAGLRQEMGNLDQAGKEAMLVELYRQDKLTHFELAKALGLSRFEADGVLKRHHVTEDLQSAEDFAAEMEVLRGLRGS